MLSNQVHFDTKNMISSFAEAESFLIWDDGEKDYLAIVTLSVLIYLCMTLIHVKGIQATVRRDMSYLGIRISDAIDGMIDAFNQEDRYSEEIDAVLAALFKIKVFG